MKRHLRQFSAPHGCSAKYSAEGRSRKGEEENKLLSSAFRNTDDPLCKGCAIEYSTFFFFWVQVSGKFQEALHAQGCWSPAAAAGHVCPDASLIPREGLLASSLQTLLADCSPDGNVLQQESQHWLNIFLCSLKPACEQDPISLLAFRSCGSLLYVGCCAKKCI